VSLIKPQFEAGRDGIGKKGIVKDEKTRQKVCEQIKVKAKEYGFENLGIIDSPIYGGDGNKEYLALFKYTEKN
jgi:23S rRNA (cytidine1920-2'-O)/16S rRNA (cytidine1409-2'-O)-methyltransferase